MAMDNPWFLDVSTIKTSIYKGLSNATIDYQMVVDRLPPGLRWRGSDLSWALQQPQQQQQIGLTWTTTMKSGKWSAFDVTLQVWNYHLPPCKKGTRGSPSNCKLPIYAQNHWRWMHLFKSHQRGNPQTVGFWTISCWWIWTLLIMCCGKQW